MSAIAFAQAGAAGPAVGAMLDAMRERGADASDVVAGPAAACGVARFEWENEIAGPARLARDGEVVVAADASLYYRDDLRRALAERGVRALDDTPASLIAAAYRAWGVRCAEHLEGDFAFVLWDAARRCVLAARDFGGRRPLYWLGAADALRIASTLRGVVAGPGRPAAFDRVAIASDLSGIDGPADETAYVGVRRLPPGATLVVVDGQATVGPHWEPPVFRIGGRASLADGAAELRALLARSVSERLAIAGPTAVSLSGGYDSTAVFASGAAVLRERGDARMLVPVSLRYPAGDPGNEDEHVLAAAGRWGASVHWVSSDEVPPLAAMDARAAARDEPYPHPFEAGLRALLARGRSLGARVLLDGVGGDQLFEASEARLADYFRTLRWRKLAYEWRNGSDDFREIFRQAVRPNMGRAALAVARALRGGRPLADPRARSGPVAWLRADAVSSLGLTERAVAPLPTAPGGHAASEAAWYFRRPLLLRVNTQVGAFALAEGVEERSPLYDRRLVAFAASRPVWERNLAGETKRLPRAAMRGLLPDSLLAPRTHRTGIPIAYLLRAIEAEMPHRLTAELREPLLADLGLVDPAGLRLAWEEYLRTGKTALAVGLYVTLEVELWLRARAGLAAPSVR